MRRASRSIPSNIREGLMRNKSNRDKINFLKDSLGSNDEILFNLNFCRDIALIDEKLSQSISGEYEIVGKQLNKFIQTLSGTSNQKLATSNQ